MLNGVRVRLPGPTPQAMLKGDLGDEESRPPSISARLLGSFAVSLDGQEVQGWPRPPARRLVELLLITPGHRVTRIDAAGVVLPDAPPEQCQRAVSKAVSQARHVLGTRAIVAEGHHLLLRGEVHTDLEDLRTGLCSALGIKAAPARRSLLAKELARALPLLPGEPDYDWVAFSRRQLEELVRAARVTLAEDTESVEGSTQGWEVAFDADPGDEEVAVGLICACRRVGADARALQVYRACRAALGRQAGASPSAQLDAAVAGLLGASAGNAGAPGRLLGRDRETAAVLTTLRGAEIHAGGAVLVSGPAGIGKTAVLEAVFATLREEGWQVSLAAARTGDELVPYAALRAAVSDLLAAAGPVPIPASIRALLRASDRRSEARWALALLAADLARVLDRLSVGSPVLVAVDDVHHCDPATHDLLGRLTAAKPARSWSLLLTARSDEPSRPVPVFPSDVAILHLAALDGLTTSALARRQLQAAGVVPTRWDELVELTVAWSRGNPLFLVELVRHVASGGELSRRHVGSVPARVVELLEQRLSACSAPARAILPLIAIAEPHADFAAVAELEQTLGLDRSLVAGVIDELIMSSTVVVSGRNGLRLSHPLWREAALSRLNPLRLASLHSQVADAIDRIPGRELVSAGHRIAAFRSAALADYAEAAARAGLAAGRVARNLVADESALQLFSAALAAFEAVPASRRRRLRSSAFAGWMDAGHIHTDRLELDAATHAYEQALGLAGSDNEYAAGYSALGGICYKRGDFEQAEATYARGLRLVAGDSIWAQARLGADIAWARYRSGDVERSLPALAAAAVQFASTRDRVSTARCFDLLAVVLEAAGRLDEAFIASDKALAMADRSGDVRLVPTLAVHRSGLLLLAGLPAAAEREARRAVQAALRISDRYLESVAQWNLAESLDAVGDLHGALACRQSEQDVLVELVNDVNLSRCLAHQASLLHRLGRRRDAFQKAAEARRIAIRIGGGRLIADVEAQLARIGAATL